VLDRGRIIYDGRSADLAGDPERMATYFGASGEAGGAEAPARRAVGE
jgi:hypothetical protein